MARKRRWICFFIFIVIVIILTIVLVLEVIVPAINKNKSSTKNASSPQVTNAPAGVGSGSSAPTSRGSNGGGTVTVTVTTTVVVVRQPAQSLVALANPPSSSRDVLMTVDTSALVAHAKSPLSILASASMSMPTMSPSPTPTSMPTAASGSLTRSFVPSGTNRILAAEKSAEPTPIPETQSTSARSRNSAQSSERRASSAWSLREEDARTTSLSSSSTQRSGSSVAARTTLPEAHAHSILSAASRAASSAKPRSYDSLLPPENSPIVTAGHSITSIIRALLRRCTSAATPTITF